MARELLLIHTMNANPWTTLRYAGFAAVFLGTAASAFAESIDTAGVLYVEPSIIVVAEGNGEGDVQQVIFTVNLGYANVGRPQSVEYEIVPGTAMPGEDYQPMPLGSLIFNVGEQSKNVVVNLVGDRQPECSEYFFLRLTRGGVQVAKVIATIRDDDTTALDGGVLPTCLPRDPSDGGADTPPDLTGVTPVPDPLDGGATPTIPTGLPPDPGTTSAPQGSDSSSGCSVARTPGSPGLLAALVLAILSLSARQRSSRG
jgi:hypothetical protein